RGVSREQARLDEWARELAPSPELRRWFGHDPARFAEFRRRYAEELAAHEAKLSELRRRAREGTLTLVYSAHDTEHNDAVVLAEDARVRASCSGRRLGPFWMPRASPACRGYERAVASALRLDQAAPYRVAGQLDPIVHAELGENVLAMPFDGLHADVELLCD